jgi:negative regulator of flagellin synthesis FlgM
MDDMRVKNASGATPITPIAPYMEQREARTAEREAMDEAGISERARELSRANDMVAASPEERALRVQALRAAVQNGKYRLDAEEVARKLLEHGF